MGTDLIAKFWTNDEQKVEIQIFWPGWKSRPREDVTMEQNGVGFIRQLKLLMLTAFQGRKAKAFSHYSLDAVPEGGDQISLWLDSAKKSTYALTASSLSFPASESS